MFAFIFSGIDFVRDFVAGSPRVVVLFLGVFSLASAVAINEWEVPKDSAAYPSAVTTLPSCVWRSGIMGISTHRGQRNVNDACGDEARDWSRRVALDNRIAVEQQGTAGSSLLNTEIVSMTAGYPIERMADSIAKYDRAVAALIVGIAKKESNWGKRVPRSDDGADCFNYWGFKGAGSRGVAMGHGCFGSPEEAVAKVGDRIAELVRIRSTSEPKNFTIWKCGSSCATHSSESVQKWISDVDQYYRVLASR